MGLDWVDGDEHSVTVHTTTALWLQLLLLCFYLLRPEITSLIYFL